MAKFITAFFSVVIGLYILTGITLIILIALGIDTRI